MENNQIMTHIETALLALGVTIGLAEIETLAGIIILGIQAILLIVRLALMLTQRKKNNDLNGAIQDVEGTLVAVADLAEREKAKQAEIARKNEEKQRKEQERIDRENAKIDAEIAKLEKKKILGPRVRKED